MCGATECAFSASGLSHFSTTTKVSSPKRSGLPSASIAGPYSMQPCSAWTAGMILWNSSSRAARLPGLAVIRAMTWITSKTPSFCPILSP